MQSLVIIFKTFFFQNQYFSTESLHLQQPFLMHFLPENLTFLNICQAELANKLTFLAKKRAKLRQKWLLGMFKTSELTILLKKSQFW